MRPRFPALPAILLALTACQTPVPKLVDPLAGIRVSPSSPYRDLVAAVVVSENTRNAIGYTRSVAARVRLAGIDADRLFSGFDAVLQRAFKSTVAVSSGGDAARAGADVLVVVDVHDELPNGFSDQKFDASLILMTPSREPIDVVRGRGASPTHMSMLGEGWGQAAEASAEQAQRELESNLLSSAKMQEFARARQGAARTGDSPSDSAPAEAPAAPAAAKPWWQ